MEQLVTRSRLRAALAQLDEDLGPTPDPRTLIERRIELLDRAEAAARLELERTLNPKTTLDKAASAINTICDPINEPLLTEIEKARTALKKLLSEID